jgi:hypothetical protein
VLILHCMECLLLDIPLRSITLEWLASCVKSALAQRKHFCSSFLLVRACLSWMLVHPWLTDFSRHMIITGKVIVIIFLYVIFVWKSKTIVDSVLALLKTEVICWHGHFETSFRRTVCYRKPLLCNSISMWLCPSFTYFCFWKHTIQRMPRLWHLPSWVGKAYASSYLEHIGCLETMFFVGWNVTAATLC